MNQDHFSRTLAQNLQAIRRRKGLTTTALAKILGVSQAKVSYIENGRGVLSARDVAVLSRRLDIPVTEFYRGLDQASAGTEQEEVAQGLVYFGAKLLAKPAGIQLAPAAFEEVLGKALSYIEDERLHRAFCAALIRQAATRELNIDRIFALVGNNPFLVQRLAEEVQLCLQIIEVLNRPTTIVAPRAARQLTEIQSIARDLAEDKIRDRAASLDELKDLASFVGECFHAKG